MERVKQLAEAPFLLQMPGSAIQVNAIAQSRRVRGSPRGEQNADEKDYESSLCSEDPDSLEEIERVNLEEIANNLMAELMVWDQTSNFTPLHPRTQYGNHAYRHAMRIRILRNVFAVPRDDLRVIQSVDAILELAKEMVSRFGKIVWYVPIR